MATIDASGTLLQTPTLSNMLAHMPAKVAIYDTEMRLMCASNKWLQHYGYNEQEVLGKNFYAIFPQTTDEWRKVHQRCMAGATEKNELDILYKPDGKEEYIKWEVTPWKKEDGCIGGIIVCYEVATENETIRLSNVKMIRELNLLNEVGNVIYNATDDYDMIDEVCKKIIQLGGYQLVWFGYAPNPLHEKQLISPLHKYGSAVHYLDNFMIDLNNDAQKTGPTATALSTGTTQVVNDFSSSFAFAPWLQNAIQHNIHSSISLPMSLIGGQKCVLCIYTSNQQGFDTEEVAMLERLCAKITYAFNAIKLKYETKIAQIQQDKLIRDLRLRNRSLEDFTYLVSHNFRAKVADLLGVATLISEHTLSEEDTKELNGEMGRIAQKLDEVIRDLHSTLLVKGHEVLNKDNIDIARLFADLSNSLQAMLPHYCLHISTDFSAMKHIDTDRYYLHEACMQLLLSFVKQPVGLSSSHIKVSSALHNNCVQLILEDDHEGFIMKDPENSVLLVYKKLYQHLTGGGIKLLYVKTIIENLGGVFSVHCEENSNIRFVIEFSL